MSDPSFEDVFGDALYPDQPADTPELTADELEGLIATAGDLRVGHQLGTPGFGPRFDGDTSQLPPEACWTLQELVIAPHVGEDAKKYWSALIQHEEVLRSRLSELGMILEFDRERGYAFTRPADDPSPYSRTLLRARTLSLAASALALYLYNQYVIAPDDPVVETSDMIDHMLGYKAPSDTDEAGFVRKVRGAIESLEKAHIIKPIPGTSRYIIYGVITSVLSAERVAALDARYRQIYAGAIAVPGSSASRTGDSADPGHNLVADHRENGNAGDGGEDA